jgi:hypothetical protein
MSISFIEFKELPKKEINKKYNLTPGKKYYIQDTSRKKDNLKTVFRGVFTHQSNGHNNFKDVEFLVNPFGDVGKPHGFNAKTGHKFMEVIDFNPTELDIKNKNKTITELHEFIHEKKAEPHDNTPPISFMGEDYRKVRNNFYNKTSPKSRTSSKSSTSPKSRTSSKSSSKKGGRKHSKGKTSKRRKI